jgi:hypothetical protein
LAVAFKITRHALGCHPDEALHVVGHHGDCLFVSQGHARVPC